MTFIKHRWVIIQIISQFIQWYLIFSYNYKFSWPMTYASLNLIVSCFCGFVCLFVCFRFFNAIFDLHCINFGQNTCTSVSLIPTVLSAVNYTVFFVTMFCRVLRGRVVVFSLTHVNCKQNITPKLSLVCMFSCVGCNETNSDSAI